MSSAPASDPNGPSSIGSKKKNRKKKGQKPKLLDSKHDNEGSDDIHDTESHPEPMPSSRTENADETDQETPNGYAAHLKTNSPNSLAAAETKILDTSATPDIMKTEANSEVEKLQSQLEVMQSAHEKDIEKLRQELEDTEAAREEAENNYENLQERVTQIKSSVAERLQRDKEQLEEAKARIDELETANEEFEDRNKLLSDENTSLQESLDDAERELSSLRSRNNLSQANWHRERDELFQIHSQLKEELVSATSAMGEWEVIAMEERARRESYSEKITELEEQVSSLRETLEKVTHERDTHAMAVDGLQRALQEIQDARKHELREMVESTEKQISGMRQAVADAEKKAAEADLEHKKLIVELERMAPFEKEVKEKGLQIGKLRHEAIVLNDHLTKALRYLKKMEPGTQVDRQIISNYLIQFLSLDRADQKRFEILQVIANFLHWTDDEKAKAGLVRGGGGASSSLRIPQSPFHRTPSTPSLNTDFLSHTPTNTRESLADLWAGFLERSADEAVAEGSRKDSVSTSGGDRAPDMK